MRSLRALFALSLLGALNLQTASVRAQAGDFVAPSVLEQTEVPYPPERLAAPHGPNQRLPELDVELEVSLDDKGAVLKMGVVVSGGADFDQQAMSVVRGWKFAPATRGGVPVASRFHIPIHFEPPPHAEPTLDVDVHGKSRAPIRGASDYRIQVGELDIVPRRSAADLLKLAPSVFLARDGGGEGHADRIYLRGFDAREGQDVELSVDGIPLNESGNYHGSGASDLNSIIPELVRGVRVLEGPFDPRQGNYAVAGSADYEIALARRGISARATYGSFNTARLLTTFGPQGESERTYAAADIYTTDGYGQNRGALRARVMGGYEGALGDATSFRIVGAGYATDYQSAGLVREDDVASGRVARDGSYDSRQGGNALRFYGGFDLESRVAETVFGLQLFGGHKTSRTRDNLTGFLQDPQLARQQPHAQRGDLLDLTFAGTTFGTRGFARYKFTVLELEQQVEVGLFARGDIVDNLQQRVLSGSEVPYRTEVDFSATMGDLGLYADLTAQLASFLSVRGGIRADVFPYLVDNRCAVKDVSQPDLPTGDASCLSMQRFGTHREPNQTSATAAVRAMPRVSLLLGPFAGFSYSLAYGQGVRSIDPSYITQDVDTPFSAVDSGDLGISYAKSFDSVSVVATTSFFVTHTDRDLIFSESEGRSTLAEGTTRSGMAAGLRLRGDFFDEAVNVSLVNARFDDTSLAVPYVPDLVFRNDGALFHDLFDLDESPLRGRIGVGVSVVSPRSLPYGQESETIVELDAAIAAEWRFLALEVEGKNLANLENRQAEYVYASDFDRADAPHLVPARHFAAGPPLGVFVSLTGTLGEQP